MKICSKDASINANSQDLPLNEHSSSWNSSVWKTTKFKMLDHWPLQSTEHKLITARKRSLGQGNVFTPVCHSVHRGGVSQNTMGWGQIPLGRPPPETAIEADGTHLTGMHSC